MRSFGSFEALGASWTVFGLELFCREIRELVDSKDYVRVLLVAGADKLEVALEYDGSSLELRRAIAFVVLSLPRCEFGERGCGELRRS